MTGEAICSNCGEPTMYGRHLHGARCGERCTDAELEALYVALKSRGVAPDYLVKELRREGKRIRHLSELSSFEVRRLTRECVKGGAA